MAFWGVTIANDLWIIIEYHACHMFNGIFYLSENRVSGDIDDDLCVNDTTFSIVGAWRVVSVCELCDGNVVLLAFYFVVILVIVAFALQ